MATLIACQNGNWTDSATWNVSASGTGSSQTTLTSNTALTTSYQSATTGFTITNGEVIDGVIVALMRESTLADGTITVGLSDDNGATWTRESTINASDLPTTITNEITWVLFTFGTSLTADGGSDYKIGIKRSTSNNTIRAYRDGTTSNWFRVLRTTATAAPAATDVTYICGATVTVDTTSSATTYGAINIGLNGKLTFGTTASTNYYLKVGGSIAVRPFGALEMGTVATPMPRSSSAVLELASTSGNQYGINVHSNASLVTQGLSRTVGKDTYWCLLTSDAAANATTLNVNTDTGWLDNDEIVIAPTGTTGNEGEKGTLNGDAGATTLTVDGFAGAAGGLQYAHTGVAPFDAEIINLTRNVKITGATSTNTSWIYIWGGASCDCDWTEFKFLGNTPNVSSSIYVSASGAGNASFNYCSFNDFAYTSTGTNYVVNMQRDDGVFTNNVAYRSSWGITTSSPTIDNQPASGPTITGNVFIYIARVGYTINVWNTTCNNNRVSAPSTGTGPLGFRFNRLTTATGLVAHSMASGIYIDAAVPNQGVLSDSIFYNFTDYSTSDAGVIINTSSTTSNGVHNSEYIFNNCQFYGGGTYNVRVGLSSAVTFNDCTFAATTSRLTPIGLFIQNNIGWLELNNCEFKGNAGLFRAHSSDIESSGIIQIGVTVIRGVANYTVFNGASNELNVVAGLRLSDTSYFSSQNHNRSSTAHKSWQPRGIISSDTVIYRTASPSERLTPKNASYRLLSGSRSFGVASGNAKTVKVWVRESVVGDGADYNGNRARLMLRRLDGAGITSTQLLDTATASSVGAWEELSATLPAVTSDSVLEVYVDCDGTTGWVNVDDWSVT